MASPAPRRMTPTIPPIEEMLLVWSEGRRVQLWPREGERLIVEDLIGDAQSEHQGRDRPWRDYQNVSFEAAPARD